MQQLKMLSAFHASVSFFWLPGQWRRLVVQSVQEVCLCLSAEPGRALPSLAQQLRVARVVSILPAGHMSSSSHVIPSAIATNVCRRYVTL